MTLNLLAGTAQAQVQATGGNVTNNYWENGTNFIAHTFTNSAVAGTLTFASGGDVEYLLVAGGGGAGGIGRTS